MKPRIVYSPRYCVEYGGHSFVAKKFGMTAEALSSFARFVEPEPPRREDLLLVHGPVWVDKVLAATLTAADLKRLELPFSPEISAAHRLAVGGTILAARHALEDGVGLNCGGGAHHAHRDHGEGYCALNDIAVAILKLRAEGAIGRAAVIDLDVHQGNGTASIFAGDPDTFTFSMHQADIYPDVKEKSSLDVELKSGMADADYLGLLSSSLSRVFDMKPDLIVYQSGVDVWENDALGGLKLTERGVRERDALVREACRIRGVPVVVTLGGGYGPSPFDTARLHAATLKTFAAPSKPT